MLKTINKVTQSKKVSKKHSSSIFPQHIKFLMDKLEKNIVITIMKLYRWC